MASYRTQTEVLEEQLLFRRCRIGREAARDIARRVEGEHGFWDFEERKRALEGQAGISGSSIEVVDAEVHDGASHQFLAGRQASGEESPRIAA